MNQVRCFILKMIMYLPKKLWLFLLNILNIDRSLQFYFPNIFHLRDRYLWKIKVFFPIIGADISFRKFVTSNIPIDIVIPTIDKDFEMLDIVLESVRLNIWHPINKIYIVSNENITGILDFCKLHSCYFVNEANIFSYSKNDINYFVNGENRSGWLYQQLLKLALDKYTECDNTLVLDSDTLFLKPKIFLLDGKTIFDQSDELHYPYFEVFHKLTGFRIKPIASFVSHYMLFNKQILAQLKLKIEKNTKLPWDKAIIANTDYSTGAGFSEYETYGNYYKITNRKNMIMNYWFNTSKLESVNKISKSFSNHAYDRTNINKVKEILRYEQ